MSYERLKFHVLLVEDNPGDVLLTQEALHESWAASRITVAEDGEQALQFLRKQGKYSEATRPDLILLDLNLPKLDGREVLAELKDDPLLRHIPVIVLTSSGAQQDVQSAYRLHANCYLTKPLDVEEFFYKVRTTGDFWLRIACLPHSKS